MHEYPAITRIRPTSASAVRPEPRLPGASSADHASPESGVSVAAALGCLIVGLRVKGVPTRRT